MPPSRRADSTIALDGDGGRSGTVVAWAVVMTVLAAVSVGLRFYVRGKMLRAIGREDWCILLALIFSIVSSGWLIQESQVGLGHHMATVSPAGMMAYLKASYIMTLFYNLSLWFTKMAILLLYLRVFKYDYSRKATYVAFGIVLIYNIWATGMYFTMCIPLPKMWNPSLEGYCHPWSVWWALTYLHIITDFIIFCLPIPVVLTMTVPIRQKVELVLVFSMGFFVCLISVLRAVWLSDLLYSPDMTWDLVKIADWSVIEVNIAIVCACLMTLKPLTKQLFGPLVRLCSPRGRQSEEDGNANPPLTVGSKSLRVSGRTRQDLTLDSRTTTSTKFAPMESAGGTSQDCDTDSRDIGLKDLSTAPVELSGDDQGHGEQPL